VDGKSNREVLVLVQNFPIFRECVEIDQLADLFMGIFATPVEW